MHNVLMALSSGIKHASTLSMSYLLLFPVSGMMHDKPLDPFKQKLIEHKPC